MKDYTWISFEANCFIIHNHHRHRHHYHVHRGTGAGAGASSYGGNNSNQYYNNTNHPNYEADDYDNLEVLYLSLHSLPSNPSGNHHHHHHHVHHVYQEIEREMDRVHLKGQGSHDSNSYSYDEVSKSPMYTYIQYIHVLMHIYFSIQVLIRLYVVGGFNRRWVGEVGVVPAPGCSRCTCCQVSLDWLLALRFHVCMYVYYIYIHICVSFTVHCSILLNLGTVRFWKIQRCNLCMYVCHVCM